MKICTGCQEPKPVEEFPLSGGNGKRSSRCKPCKLEYDRAYYLAKQERINSARKVTRKANTEATRQAVWDYLRKNPCIKCGEPDPIVLEFDHRDRATKSHNVADMLNRNYSVARVMVEIAKCDVLCANCHRRRTSEQFGWMTF